MLNINNILYNMIYKPKYPYYLYILILQYNPAIYYLTDTNNFLNYLNIFHRI